MSDARRPQVGVHAFGDSAIELGIRILVRTEKLHDTRYRCSMAIHKALMQQGIVTPFPQREVRMVS